MLAKNKFGLYSVPEEIIYTYTAKVILNGRVHEESTIEFLQSQSGNIIHAGCGFGDFLPGLKNCSKVFTFEPNDLMFQSSLETIKLNNLDNIEIFPFALGNYDGLAFLKRTDNKGLEMGPRSEINDDHGTKVEIRKLDSVIPENCKISLIHLDLEGYEIEALKGAKQLIERDKPIIVLEIDSRAVVYNDFMATLGYSPIKQLIYNSDEKMVFVNTVYAPQDTKQVNKDYWSQDFPRPLAPDEDDVKIFLEHLVSGKTLLLGCTKNLIKLSDTQLDLDPWYKGPNTIIGDWINNQDFYQNIICDGSLCFTKELTDNLLQMASQYCNVFIARTFTKKLSIMRIADYFPQPQDFTIEPTKTIVFDDYSFYIWNFPEKK